MLAVIEFKEIGSVGNSEVIEMRRVYFAVLILLVFSLLFLPALAEAHGGQGGGHGGGHAGGHHGHGKAHGGFHRGFYGDGDGEFHSWLHRRFHGGGDNGLYMTPPVYGTYPMCYEFVQEHRENQWDPKAKRYVNIFVPDHFVAIPCQ